MSEFIFISKPKPFEGDRDHRMEVLVGGLGDEIYEVEKGHHLNWVQTHLKIENPEVAQQIHQHVNSDEVNLPRDFFNLFPSFIRIVIIEKEGTLFVPNQPAQSELTAYFETKQLNSNLNKAVFKILRMFKRVERLEFYFHDEQNIHSFSRRDWLLQGFKKT